jgi:hypothetical protein
MPFDVSGLDSDQNISEPNIETAHRAAIFVRPENPPMLKAVPSVSSSQGLAI